MITLALMFWFAVKHFLCDFPLQAHPYMYKNKGIYGHGGGISHSWIHCLGTFLVLVWFTDIDTAVQCAVADGVIHYHIDYLKMKIGVWYNLNPNNSEWYWILLGLDQFLHTLTYLAIIYVIVWW